MAAPKTIRNNAPVKAFLKTTEPSRQEDCKAIMDIMAAATGEKPFMWGEQIIGFDSYHYVYASGREGDWPLTALSPRKQNISVYVMDGFAKYEKLLEKLGKHKTGKSCLYIKRLTDVDTKVLKTLIERSVKNMRKRSHQS